MKYIIRSAGYGIMVAVVLLLLIPELRDNNLGALNIFQSPMENVQPLSYAKAVSLAGPSVVNIYSQKIQTNIGYSRTPQKSTRLGSGVIMDSKGYILTNFHVVQNADSIQVLLQTGEIHAAELIGYDIPTDLAVLKVNASNLPVIPQDEAQTPLTGDVVLAIGNPLGLGQTVTQGIISATGRRSLSTTNYLELLQMDAAINEGNSGGALINTNGELVGINSRKFHDQQRNIQGIFFAVPYELANKIMHIIIKHGSVIRGWLGVESTILTSTDKFVINKLSAGGPADIAGIKEKDVIYQIGETPITSISQALNIVAETRPGTTLLFKVMRNTEMLELPVTITEKTDTLNN